MVGFFPMTRPITFAPGELYHVYNRGTEKRLIYLEHKDFARFQALMHACNQPGRIEVDFRGPTSNIFKLRPEKQLVDIAAYCLMPNHFHLLIQERDSGGISKYMQKLITGYTMYFNKKSERTGVLFQGKFKAQHVDSDLYLKYLVAYIHLNPAKIIDPSWRDLGSHFPEQIREHLKKYQYSSFREYSEKDPRVESLLVSKELLKSFYDAPTDIASTITDFISHKPSE
jgi:putative transposase